VDDARVPAMLGTSILFLLLAAWCVWKRRADHSARGWRRAAALALLLFGAWSMTACLFGVDGGFAFIRAAVDDQGQAAYRDAQLAGSKGAALHCTALRRQPRQSKCDGCCAV